MTLPVNRHAEAGQRAAERSTEIFQSPRFQEKLHCEQQRLEQELFADVVSGNNSPDHERKSDNSPTTIRIYLFFSSSVAEETIRAYIATIANAEAAEIALVLRGLVKGMDFQASAGYFRRILQEDQDCRDTRESQCQSYRVPIKIDPVLFDRYGITRVPALVYVGDNDTYLVRGDMGLVSLLERIDQEAHSPELTGLIGKLRGGH